MAISLSGVKEALYLAKHNVDNENWNALIPHIMGQPGIGKSSIVYEFAEEIGAKVIEMRTTTKEPQDVGGLPARSATDVSRFTYLQPDWMPSDAYCKRHKYVILFLDEFLQADRQMQNGMSELILNRRSGKYELPDNVIMVAASNRAKDRAGITQPATHIAGRFSFIETAFSTEDFVVFCEKSNLPEHLVAFTKYRPSVLDSFDPKKMINCTPRSMVSAAMAFEQTITSPGVTNEIVKGTIGEGAMAEYAGFLRVFKEIDDIDQIMANPENAKVPDSSQLDRQYAIAQLLLTKTDDNTISNVFKYVTRMSSEIQVSYVKDLLRRQPDSIDNPVVADWADDNFELLAA